MSPSKSKTDAIVVLITAANAEEATRLAENLVESHLAACVQILPTMLSIYFWKGEIQRDREVLLLVKTTVQNFAQLEGKVRELHSYETPEIIALPVTAASEPYLNWLMTEGSTVS